MASLKVGDRVRVKNDIFNASQKVPRGTISRVTKVVGDGLFIQIEAVEMSPNNGWGHGNFEQVPDSLPDPIYRVGNKIRVIDRFGSEGVCLDVGHITTIGNVCIWNRGESWTYVPQEFADLFANSKYPSNGWTKTDGIWEPYSEPVPEPEPLRNLIRQRMLAAIR